MSAVWLSSTCRVCLASDREMYHLVNTALEGTYERVTSGTLAVEGWPCCVCSVCLSALRRCRRFIDTARKANDALDRWIRNHPNTDTLKLTECPLFSFTQSPMTIFEFTCQESGIHAPEVKQERDTAENEDSEIIHHNNGTSNDEGNFLKVEIKCEVTSDDDNDNTQISDNIGSHNTQVLPKSECTNECDEMIEIEIDPQALYDVKYDVSKKLGNNGREAAPGVSNVRLGEDAESGPKVKKRRLITSEPQHENSGPAAALNKRNMFFCQQCNYNTKNKKLLKAHLTKHTGIKPFACDKCDYKCNYKGSLKKHLLRHTVEKPFFCDKCDYKCCQMGHLRRHLLLHTGEKPFTCDQCDYKSVQKGDLKRHLLTHTGEKPFSCDKCDYKCIQKGTLKRHLLTHDGEKPFSCDKCDNKYTSKCALDKHMKKFHPDNK